ncbi:uncharacterized protein LOC143287233 [Babylonia areolata]|uniref:uncharacterized protein LOC143287233 n=1 Tax=Babylonia areolata TaxID=304850 RepID=UPI003FD30CDC
MVQTLSCAIQKKKSDTLTHDDLERADDFDDTVSTPVALLPPDVGPGPHTVRSRIVGFCCGPQPAVTAREKRVQVLKVLSLTLLPILGLWAFTAYGLSDSIEVKMEIEQTQISVKFSVEIGIFLDRIQRERDMSVLYLTILGPETRAFLQNEYILTDEALQAMSGWPVRNDFHTVFRSKQSFQDFLNDYRNKLDPHTFNIYSTMDFYNGLIERFVEWLYGSIRESSMASIWKVLVAYQKIVTGMEHIGIERALGTVFFVEGQLPPGWHERYNYRVNIFRANYRSAVFYSHIVDPMYQQLVQWSDVGRNHDPITVIIDSFRDTIQHCHTMEASITKGQWWFDNMTVYLDRLLVIQQQLATFITGELQNIIDEKEKNLTISACFLALVILMCPVLIYSLEALTSDVQTYAIAVGTKTQELSRARENLDSLQYHKVPSTVANRLRHGIGYSAEYFKSVTVLFVDVHDFAGVMKEHVPGEVVQLLDTVTREMELIMDRYEVYKASIMQDSYMVASGLPLRNGGRHSAVVGSLGLALVDMVKGRAISVGQHRVCLRVGIDTGPCLAGVVGKTLPRYCLFGDVIRVASKMMHFSLPNKVHVSYSTARALKKHDVFLLKSRGNVQIKDKDCRRRTFWLEGVADSEELGKLLVRRVNPASAPLNLSPMMAAKLQSYFGIRLERQLTQPRAREGRRAHKDSSISLPDSSHDSLSIPTSGKRRTVSVTDQTRDDAPAQASGPCTLPPDTMPTIKHAWDQAPDYRRDKGVTRKNLVPEKRSLGSISESLSRDNWTLPEQAVEAGSSHPVESCPPGVSSIQITTVTADHLAVSAVSAEAATMERKEVVSAQPDPRNSVVSIRAEDETRTSTFSRSSSLESQLPRKASREVEIRKGSWPEKKAESGNAQSSHKKLTPEQHVYSLSCLPGTGDVKARLEWELQQSSWFLQFANPSIRKHVAADRTRSDPGHHGGKEPPSSSQSLERGSSAGTESWRGGHTDALQPAKEKLAHTFPITFQSVYPTPANSPYQSTNSSRSSMSTKGADADAS